MICSAVKSRAAAPKYVYAPHDSASIPTRRKIRTAATVETTIATNRCCRNNVCMLRLELAIKRGSNSGLVRGCGLASFVEFISSFFCLAALQARKAPCCYRCYSSDPTGRYLWRCRIDVQEEL